LETRNQKPEIRSNKRIGSAKSEKALGLLVSEFVSDFEERQMLIEALLTWTTRLALLSLRRLSFHSGLIGQLGIRQESGVRNQGSGNRSQGSGVRGQGTEIEAALDSWSLFPEGRRVEWMDLVRAIGQAMDRLWLTIEVFLSWKELEPKLNIKGRTVLRAMGECSFFRHLYSIGSDVDWQELVREVHSWRKLENPISAELDAALLRREFSYSNWPADAEANLEGEWNVLWELAGEISRGHANSMGSLFQVHTDQGDALLVGLLALLVSQQLKLRDSLRKNRGPSRPRIPDAVISWLIEEQETLTALLDEIVSGITALKKCSLPETEADFGPGSNLGADPSARPSALLGQGTGARAAVPHMAQGDAYRLRAEHELAITEYTSALVIESDNVSALIRRGQCFGLQGHYQRAIDDFTAALRINPGSELALHHRGRAFASQGNPSAAIADFNQALRINPGNAWTMHYQGETWVDMGEIDRALLAFNSAIRLNPEATLSYICRASVYGHKKQYDQAIADYGNALGLDPLNVQFLLRRGVVYRQAGRLDRAEEDFEKAWELISGELLVMSGRTSSGTTPHSPDATPQTQLPVQRSPLSVDLFRERAVLYRLRGDYEKALADLNAALDIGGDHADCYYQRGLVYKALGVWKRGLDDLNRALQLNDRLPEAFDHRAEIYASQGRDDLAVEDVKRAIAIDPGFAMAYVHHARLLLKIGRLKEALVECDQALQRNPRLTFAHLTRGTIASHMGDYLAAVESFTEAIRLDAKNGRAFYHRGLAHAKRNSLSQALDDLTESIKLDPQARTFSDRATVFARLGEHDKALSDLAAAVRLDARYAAMYCTLRGQIHRKQQQYQWAAADYRLALLFDKDNVSARTGLEQVQKALRALLSRQQERTDKGIRVMLEPPKDANGEEKLADNVAADRGDIPTTADVPPQVATAPEPQSPEQPTDLKPSSDDDILIDFSAALKDISDPSEVQPNNLSSQPAPPKGAGERSPEATALDKGPDATIADSNDFVLELSPAAKKKSAPSKDSSKRRWLNVNVEPSIRPAGPAEEKSSPEEVRAKGASVSPDQGADRAGSSRPVANEFPRQSKPTAKTITRAPSPSVTKSAFQRGAGTGAALVQTTPDAHSATKEYDTEQARIRTRAEAEDAMQAAQVGAEAELKKKRDEAWAAARRAKPAETDDEDSDQPFMERWKKPLIGVAAALVLGLIFYYGRGYWQTHRKVDPPLDVDVVWQDFSNDPAGANKKYANQRVSIVGKLIIEQQGRNSPRQVYFQAPEEKRLRIHCTFSAPNELSEVDSGRPPGLHLINGEFKPYEAGPVIELSNCEYVGGGTTPVSGLSAALNPLAKRKEPGVRGQESETRDQETTVRADFWLLTPDADF
jgi:tetratricopeptide (TPR) repeat protein